jgi:hypothetical protein
MTPIEWMAAIVAIVVVIKLLVVLIKPSAWMNMVVKPIYSNNIFLMLVGLVLAGGSLWYLINSGITIVQIFAVFFFLSMTAMITAATYSSDIVAVAKKMLKNKAFLKKAWLSIIIWFALAIWALKELFM